MTIFNDIQRSIAPELKQLNESISASLVTSNELMNGIVENYLKTKGKQIRPILVILSAKLFGGNNANTISGAAAVEMLHNASLIHDDVVDDSDIRRGIPTINSVWDNRISVLIGDYFVASALRHAVKTADIRIVETISDIGQTLSLGEINQIEKARNHTFSENAYLEIISQKTASLFEACVKIGAYSVNASEEEIRLLVEFARLFGLCFQIRDDIFDYFDSDAIGKPTGNDLREGKVTLPLLYALSRKDHPRHDEMMELINRENLDTDSINTLIEFAKDCGGIDYAYNYMVSLREKAALIMDQLPHSPEKKRFMEMFDFIIARKN